MDIEKVDQALDAIERLIEDIEYKEISLSGLDGVTDIVDAASGLLAAAAAHFPRWREMFSETARRFNSDYERKLKDAIEDSEYP